MHCNNNFSIDFLQEYESLGAKTPHGVISLREAILPNEVRVREFLLDINPLMAIGNYSYQFLICCPRDCVSRTANEKLVTIVANRH